MTCILLSLLLGASDSAAPLAAAEPLRADLGTARTGPPIVRSWMLTHSAGPGVVAVTAVEASCGCTAPTVTAKSLRAGETATLTVTVNTLTQPAGRQTWRATLRGRYLPDGSGEPADFEMVFVIQADLVREVSVTPPTLALSTATEATRTFTVTDARTKPFRVLAAATGNPYVVAKVKPGPAGARDTEIEVCVKADCPPGATRETVTITTDDAFYGELRLPLHVVKRDPSAVVPSPEDAVVRFGAGQEAASALVQLRSPARGRVRIESASADHPAVTVRFAAASGLVGTVRVVVDRARAGDAGTDLVRVKLAEPAGEVVTIPVRWDAPR